MEFKPFKTSCERIFFSIRIVFPKNVPILIKCPLGVVCKLCPVYTYPDSFVSANILLRIQKFTRPHVSGFVAFSTVHTYLRKRYESDSNSLELLREHALSEITSPRCRLLLAILTLSLQIKKVRLSHLYGRMMKWTFYSASYYNTKSRGRQKMLIGRPVSQSILTF